MNETSLKTDTCPQRTFKQFSSVQETVRSLSKTESNIWGPHLDLLFRSRPWFCLWGLSVYFEHNPFRFRRSGPWWKRLYRGWVKTRWFDRPGHYRVYGIHIGWLLFMYGGGKK